MLIDSTTLLFFDASCLIAAAGSPSGGSGFLITLVQRKRLRGAVSQAVLLEAERNIQAKMADSVLIAFHDLLLETALILAPIPRWSGQEQWSNAVNPKDAHVVSAALAIDAAYLLSLDRQLNAQVNQAETALHALTPGDFIRLVLPRHSDYPRLRD